MRKIITNILTLVFFLHVSLCWAQGRVEISGTYERSQRGKPIRNNFRLAPVTRSLPFFDNFIDTDSGGVPLNSLWYQDGGVKISNGMTKNNIDYNVAVFDGTDSLYIPYNNFENSSKRGVTDSLVSQYIDLSQQTLPTTDSVKLFLTFFVQNGGYGEVSDARQGDQFSLSFRNKSGQWQQVWVRKDSVPNVTDTLLLDRGFANFFRNIYKPVYYINTLEDSINYVKRVYPLLANFTIADQVLKDSLNYFFSVWPGPVDFSEKRSRTDSLDLYRKVYRNDPNYEANYQAFFKNIYHLPLNFNTKADSLNYFKRMYPNELFPEDYYRFFFGKPVSSGNRDGFYKQLPVLYKDFSAVAVKRRVDSLKALYSGGILAQKLDSLSMDSLRHYRGITTQSFVQGGYNEFTRYDYVFDKNVDTSFFHDKFQMAFVSNGRQSGSFDVWGLDYVYLRVSGLKQDRIARGIATINDATISLQLPSVLANYSSIPWNHFSSSTPLTGQARVLNQVLLRDSLYTNLSNVVIGYLKSGQIVDTIYRKPESIDYDQYRLDSTYKVKSPIIEVPQSPTTLVSIGYLVSVSGKPQVTLKNDTIKRNTVLDNYYAYDDGEAERAFEVSGKYSELAYRFDIEPGVYDTLTQLRIYFPKIISSNESKSLSIKIWKRISQPSKGRMDDSVCYAGTKIIKYSDAKDSLGGFIEFNIDSIVQVRDSIYVGYELLSADPIYVGYDLNPTLNTSKKLFYNIDGDWQRFSGAAGNLMIRPVFGKYKANATVREGWGDESMDYQVYPNPVLGGQAMVKGEMPVLLQLFDLSGREYDFSYDQSSGKVDVSQLKSGIYTLKIIGPEVVVYKKIIVN